MGRNRGARRDNSLPDYVYRVKSKNRVLWREYLGQGRFGRTVTLVDDRDRPLPHDAPQRDIFAAYKRQIAQDRGRTLEWLFEKYLQSLAFQGLTKRTQDHYRWYIKTISGRQLKNGRRFGDVALTALEPPVFARYRDARSATNEHQKGAPVAANRELQFLSAVCSWAVEQGHLQSNPAAGVRRNREESRTRYIYDWELELVEYHAQDYVAVMMELAYLLRARWQEVASLDRRRHILEEGVWVERTKRSESEITRWSPRLRDAVNAAQSINPSVFSRWLLHGQDGEQIKYQALKSAYRRAMDRALEKGLKERFTFHDIKAKGITDHKTNAGGHRSQRMRDVYVRLPSEEDATR